MIDNDSITLSGTTVKNLLLSTCLFILTAPFLSLSAEAEPRYVSDVLYVPLRSGMGNQYRIVHQGLRSGTEVTLLQQNEAEDGEDWTQVRTPNGTEGWIRSQFLVSEPTAALRLEAAEQRAEEAAQQREQMRQRLEDAGGSTLELENELEQLREDYSQLQEEHEQLRAISSDSLNLHDQHQELSESYQMLQTRHEVIQAENDRLRREQRYQDWLYGGGILVAGVLLSLILQALGRRRRQSEWR